MNQGESFSIYSKTSLLYPDPSAPPEIEEEKIPKHESFDILLRERNELVSAIDLLYRGTRSDKPIDILSDKENKSGNAEEEKLYTNEPTLIKKTHYVSDGANRVEIMDTVLQKMIKLEHYKTNM